MNEWNAADKATFDAANGKAEYGKCVEISTKASIREMVLPGLVAVLSPVLVGFLGVPKCWVVFWRCDRFRGIDGHLPVQCGWCLG